MSACSRATMNTNYAAVAARVDGVVLMNYDEHYPGAGTPGPVASQDWFVENLKAGDEGIPQDKLICAIGNLRLRLGHRDRRTASCPQA